MAEEPEPLESPAEPTPEEEPVQRLSPAELFDKYDSDGGGTIDAEELDRLLKECNYEPDDGMAMELMAEFGDGMSEELDFEHFSAMVRALDKRVLFKQYDVDGNGSIDATELTEMLKVTGHEEQVSEDSEMAAKLIEQIAGEGATELSVEQFGEVLYELDKRGMEVITSKRQLSTESIVVAEEVQPPPPSHFVFYSCEKKTASDPEAPEAQEGGMHIFVCSNAESRHPALPANDMAVFFCSYRDDEDELVETN